MLGYIYRLYLTPETYLLIVVALNAGWFLQKRKVAEKNVGEGSEV